MRLLPDLSDEDIIYYLKRGYHTAPEMAHVIYPTESYSEYSFVLAKIRVRLQRMEKRGLVRKVGFARSTLGKQSRVWDVV
ncbi:MAG: hypothetical protein IIY21_04415 [Clostridiales bacterium]|nr:hypothetical protein [Clostridiales bacterium]MBQ1573870.1 hypothetical protein [Clostridiales bacterium]